MLDLRVENTGDEAGSLFATDQLLIGEGGTQYSADDIATLTLAGPGDTGASLFSQINPGNAVDAQMVFDVPDDAEIVSAELHDSAFSGGVQVNLQ